MYALIVEHEGFDKEIREGLHFFVGQQATADVILSVATLATKLLIHWEASQVETTKSVIDKVILREQMMICRSRTGGRHRWRYWPRVWFPRAIRRSQPLVEASRVAA